MPLLFTEEFWDHQQLNINSRNKRVTFFFKKWAFYSKICHLCMKILLLLLLSLKILNIFVNASEIRKSEAYILHGGGVSLCRKLPAALLKWQGLWRTRWISWSNMSKISLTINTTLINWKEIISLYKKPWCLTTNTPTILWR